MKYWKKGNKKHLLKKKQKKPCLILFFNALQFKYICIRDHFMNSTNVMVKFVYINQIIGLNLGILTCNISLCYLIFMSSPFQCHWIKYKQDKKGTKDPESRLNKTTQPADVIKSSITVMALFLLNQTHWCMCVSTAESWIVLVGISPWSKLLNTGLNHNDYHICCGIECKWQVRVGTFQTRQLPWAEELYCCVKKRVSEQHRAMSACVLKWHSRLAVVQRACRSNLRQSVNKPLR